MFSRAGIGTRMRVVFIGASKFGERCLRQLTEISSCEVCGIITNDAVFKISYAKSGVVNCLHEDFTSVAAEHCIPIYRMEAGMNEAGIANSLMHWEPDAIIVVGWYHMIPKRILEQYRVFGMHASLLPDYSGGAPLVWAMINGEKATGITFFQFDSGVDSGPIVGQEKVKIDEDDTIATLYQRIENVGVRLLQRYIPKLASGNCVFTQQDDSKRRTFPQRSPEDGKIDWPRMTAERVRNWVRAQTRPYPGASAFFADRKISIWSVEVVTRPIELAAGEVLVEGATILVGCAKDSAVSITDSSEGLGYWRQLSGQYLQG